MKKALLSAIAMLVLALTLLVGSTFAWFSGNFKNTNRIKFGEFKVELEIRDLDKEGQEWYTYNNSLIEQLRHEREAIQPGTVFTKQLKVKNTGNIDVAFTYKLSNYDSELGELKFYYGERRYYEGEHIYVEAGAEEVITFIYKVSEDLTDTSVYNTKDWHYIFDFELDYIQAKAVSNFINVNPKPLFN